MLGPIVKNICGIVTPHEIKTLAPKAATAIKIESVMFEQAMTPETFSSGALLCMTAYNGTIYNPPQKAITKRQNVIIKFSGREKNSTAPISGVPGAIGGLLLTYHKSTLAIAIPYAAEGTYFVVILPFNIALQAIEPKPMPHENIARKLVATLSSVPRINLE